MPRKSLLDRYETYVAAAILGAQGNTRERGFRQYDVRFFIEIFTNWMAPFEGKSTLFVQNNQIARYLQAMVDEGLARKRDENGKPFYNLTKNGVFEMLRRLLQFRPEAPREQVFFVVYCVLAYEQRMHDLFRSQVTKFPQALRMELEEMTDPTEIINHQIERTKREIHLLDRRLEDIGKVRALVKTRLEKGEDYSSIVNEVDKIGFFGQTSQRLFAEVFQVSSDKQGIWEMDRGNKLRALTMWDSAYEVLELHLKRLQFLREKVPELRRRVKV